MRYSQFSPRNHVQAESFLFDDKEHGFIREGFSRVTDGGVGVTTGELSNKVPAALADVGFDGQLAARVGDDLIVVDGTCNRLTRVSVTDGSTQVHPGSVEVNQSSTFAYVAADDEAIYCANRRRIARFGHSGDFAIVTEEAVESAGWVTGLQVVEGLLYYGASGDLIDDKDLLRVLDPSSGEITKLQRPEPQDSRVFADPSRGQLFWTTESNAIQLQVCIGSTENCLKPVEFSSVPFAIKARAAELLRRPVLS